MLRGDSLRVGLVEFDVGAGRGELESAFQDEEVAVPLVVELGSDTWSFEMESLRFSAPLPLMRYAASSLYLSTLSFGSDCALRRSLSLCPFSTPPFCSRSSAAAKSAPMPPLGY